MLPTRAELRASPAAPSSRGSSRSGTPTGRTAAPVVRACIPLLGASVEVTYRPTLLAPPTELLAPDQAAALPVRLAAALVSWDLEQDGRPLPPTAEHLQRLKPRVGLELARGLVAAVGTAAAGVAAAPRAADGGKLYHLDTRGGLGASAVIRPIELPLATPVRERATYETLCPTGVSPYGRNMLRITATPDLHAGGVRLALVDWLFEAVRRERFPERPSRYSCLFAADSPGPLLRWRAEVQARGGLVGEFYEVEDQPESVFRGCAELVTEMVGTIPEILERARLYWDGAPNPRRPEGRDQWEWLVPLPARLRRLGPLTDATVVHAVADDLRGDGIFTTPSWAWAALTRVAASAAGVGAP